MSKTATLKDVLYGLEFGRQHLVRWPNPGGGRPAWSMEPSGVKVPAHVADKVREGGSTMQSAESKYGEHRYVWKVAA